MTPQFPELTFEERDHIYRLNEVVIPSVTTIMRPLSEAHYGGFDQTVLAAAAKRGQTVHQAIENHLKFGIVDIPPEHEGYYRSYLSFWEAKQPQLLHTEGRVYHKFLRYAGTADLGCLIDGMRLCVDFKTSAQIVEMLARVQLEAYARAFASHDVEYDGKAIVQLGKDGQWVMKLYPSGDTEAYEVFGACLNLHNYINKYKGMKP